MRNSNYVVLKDLEVYQLSRQLSTMAWKIFCGMKFEDRKHMGDQFLRLVDSVGANIAEGYGRYYYLDKVRFYYNSRASHLEAFIHWLELLCEREKISKAEFDLIFEISQKLLIKLNNFITITIKNAKNNNKHVNIE